jgi:hypothetical protein
MYYLIEEMANQREREIVARTRSPLFTHHPATAEVGPARSRRSERGGLPALSWGKWRHWATRPDVHCSRAAATAGAC